MKMLLVMLLNIYFCRYIIPCNGERFFYVTKNGVKTYKLLPHSMDETCITITDIVCNQDSNQVTLSFIMHGTKRDDNHNCEIYLAYYTGNNSYRTSQKILTAPFEKQVQLKLDKGVSFLLFRSKSDLSLVEDIQYMIGSR